MPDRAEAVTIEIPWPFVTQGATPVHVYDAAQVEHDRPTASCRPAASGYQLTITMDDWLNSKNGCDRQ